MDVEHFVKDTPKLNDYYKMIFDTKPHPVDEEALEYYLKKLKVIIFLYVAHLQEYLRKYLTFINAAFTIILNQIFKVSPFHDFYIQEYLFVTFLIRHNKMHLFVICVKC